eukprot:6203944-Pleurochrysis_carterae.AAC.2
MLPDTIIIYLRPTDRPDALTTPSTRISGIDSCRGGCESHFVFNSSHPLSVLSRSHARQRELLGTFSRRCSFAGTTFLFFTHWVSVKSHLGHYKASYGFSGLFGQSRAVAQVQTAIGMFAAVCFTVLSAVALYEEPPGGCRMSPDSNAAVDTQRIRAAPHYKSAAASGPAASRLASGDGAGRDSLNEGNAAAEEMERELYEKESEEYIKQDDDWVHRSFPILDAVIACHDDIERDYRRELFFRDVVQKIAATLTMAFVCWLLWARYEQLRARRPRTAAAPPASTPEQTNAPAAAPLPPASAADAHDLNAAGAIPDAASALNGAKHH